ncbi:uncharacterized protein LOC144119260 [Amblyomma americanum]
MKKPERNSGHHRKIRAEVRSAEKNRTDVAATTMAPAALVVGRPTTFDEGMAAQGGTAFAKTDTFPSARASPHFPHDRGLVRVDLGDEKEAFNPMRPFSAVTKRRPLKHPKREALRKDLPSSLPTPSDTRGDKLGTSQSAIGSSVGRKQAAKRSRNFSFMFWREPKDGRSRITKSSESTNSPSAKKPAARFFRSLSIMASRLTRKRTSQAQFNRINNESSDTYCGVGASSAPSERQVVDASENPDVSSAPPELSYSISTNAILSSSPQFPVNTTQKDSTGPTAAAAAISLTTQAIIPVAVTVTDNTGELAPGWGKSATDLVPAAKSVAVAPTDGLSMCDTLVRYESETQLRANPVSSSKPAASENALVQRADPLGETVARPMPDLENRSTSKVDEGAIEEHPIEEMGKDSFEGKDSAAMATRLKGGAALGKEMDGRKTNARTRQQKDARRSRKKERRSGKTSSESSRKSSDRSSTSSKSTGSTRKQLEGHKPAPTSDENEVPLHKCSDAEVPATCHPNHVVKASELAANDKKNHFTEIHGPDHFPAANEPRPTGIETQGPRSGLPHEDRRGKNKNRLEKRSSDASDNQHHRQYSRPKTAAPIGDPPKLLGECDRCSHKPSGTDLSANEEIKKRMEILPYLPPEKKEPSRRADKQEAVVAGTEKSKHTEGKEARGSTRGDYPPRKCPSMKLEANKEIEAAMSGRGFALGGHRESHGSAHLHDSQGSKPTLKSHRCSDILTVNESASKTKEAPKSETGKVRCVQKLGSAGAPSKPSTIDGKGPQQLAETAKALKCANGLDGGRPAETAELFKPVEPADFIDTRSSRHSVSMPMAVPSVSQPVRPSSLASVAKCSDPSGTDDGGEALRRKPSAVSFDAGVREESERKPVPLNKVPEALAHLEDIAPRPTRLKGLSTIVKGSGSLSTASRAQRASFVDFGAAKCAIISPARKLTGSSVAGHMSASSRLSRTSTGSLSSLIDGDLMRPPITLRRTMRNRSCVFDETTTRPSMTVSQIGSQVGWLLKKKKKSARADVHNAFLLGPSLMTVLGNMCSFHEGTNKRALLIASHAPEGTDLSLSIITWTIVTLPAALVALVACTAVIWLLYVRPHDPAPLSSENVAVMEAAGERSASRGKRRGVQCACATYLAIFSLSYVPSVVHQLEPRGALIGALTSMVLVTSLLTSCLQAAFEFIRRVWQMLPWGAILLLGSTHVASELVQAHELLVRAFELVPISFWEECTVLEVQTMLAFAASLMAEAADKQVLLEIMSPIVVQLAQLKQMHLAYYAIPVVVGASSNVIMPASVPIALLHELSRVSFWKLLLLGLFAKILVMSTVIVTVNIADRTGLLANQTSMH